MAESSVAVSLFLVQESQYQQGGGSPEASLERCQPTLEVHEWARRVAYETLGIP